MRSLLSLLICLVASVGPRNAARSETIVESSRSLPVEKSVDVLVVGGGSAAVAAAVSAAGEGATVFLAAPRPSVGDDVAGTLRMFESEFSVPIAVKRAADETLAKAGVGYLTGLYPTDVLRDSEGRVAGAVFAGKSGRAVIRARHVIDASERAVLAHQAGVPFTPFVPGAMIFERTVVSTDEPKDERLTVVERTEKPLKSGRTFVCRLAFEMKDLSYASFCEAEQHARDLTWTPGELDAADRLFFVPPVGATGSVPGLSIVGAWGLADPKQRAEALKPSVAKRLGEEAGRRAARAAKASDLAPLPQPALRSTASGDLDTREFTWGFRPFERGLDRVMVGGAALAVLGRYDTVVVGGGTSGGPAAIASARGGAKTLLVDYLYGFGGVSTLGMIGKYWYGNKCGFTSELERGVKAMNASVYVNAKSEWMRREARRAGAEIWFGTMGCGAVVREGRVAGVVVVTPDGRGVVLAKNVIDATGNSDIAAAAGAATEFVSDREIVIQDAGTPVKPLGKSYENSDWSFVNDGDAYDLWLFQLRGRKGAKTFWDQSNVVGSRERRRIRGVYVPTAADMVSRRTFPDTVVMAQSNFDSHGSTDDPFCMFKWLSGRNTLHINVPYRAIVPETLDGVAVVGLGVSAKHDALPIMRMQADLHNLGYAAGLAAAQAAKRGYDFRSVDVHDLQLELVKEKIITPDVLGWKDSVPDDARFAESVRSCANEGYPGLETVLLRPLPEALAALRAAYADERDAKRRLAYAAILGSFGDATGADALVDFFTGKGPEVKFPVRKKEDGSPADPNGRRLANREMMLIALGRTRDARAVPILAAEAAKIGAKSWVGFPRAVSLAAEGLANPALAPALEAALRRPGVMGHAVKEIDKLAPGGGYKILPEVHDGLVELNLARALLACGDPNGLARGIFHAYADDPRGIWALHARQVLEKHDNQCKGVPHD